jgi:ABC-2 type transport system permease protein
VDKKNFKQFLRLYLIYAKMDLAWLLRDRVFASIAIMSDMISNISVIAGIFLLAWKFGGIGGMDKYEVLLMLAYTTLITGIFQTFFSGNNTGHISRRIGRGQLEHMFIQPISLPVQLLTEGFIPFSGSSNLFTGGILLYISISNLGITTPWWWFLLLAGNLLVTISIIIASSYLASSITFYAPVQAEEISTLVIDTFGSISEFPLSGMPSVLQISLLTIIPIGLLGWFPTLVLLGKPPFGLPEYYPVIIAIVLALCATYFFKKGLNYYAKKGINRYLPIGHRR